MDTGSRTGSYLHRNILDLIERQAERCPNAIAIEDSGDLALTYQELAARVGALSRSLTGHGAGRTARVAIVLPNGAEMAVTLLGVAAAAVGVPLNPAYRGDEFRSYFETVRVGFLVVGEGSPAVARTVAEEMGIAVLELSDDGGLALAGTAAGGADRGEATAPPAPDDIALILMTSGSTGRAKKVPLTHRNLCVSVSDVCRSMALGSGDRCLCMWEQFHIGGLTDLLLAPLAAGGTVICTTGFDPAEFYRLLGTKHPTWFQGVPTALHELAFHAGRNPVTTRPTSLRLIRSVAAALGPQLMAEIETLFGVPVIQTFGMTEAGPLITSTLLPPAVRKPGSVGQSCGPEIRILDPDGAALGRGEIGEVAVRGDNVVAGYEDDPEANAHSFRGGWFLTGDTGYLDADGHLFLQGRLKQMINRGGEKVNPQEVDDVLLSHPAVAEAASFAVRHRTLGEDVAVAVVLKPSAAATEAELRGFAAERLAPFKVPQRVNLVGRIPRNAVGKIDRLALSEIAEVQSRARSQTGPGTELEERIARIWADELNLDAVGIDDNFFAIGGESLSGVRVFLAVEKAFGKALPVSALTGITTVREMARSIEAADTSPDHAADVSEDGLTETEKRSIAAVMAMGGIPVARPGSAFKAVNTGGSRPPLFWCFNSPAKEMGGLAPHLDPEQPLYGLYSGGWLLPKTDEVRSKMARFYAEEIVSLFPDGPYRLGGNCGGSKMALEIARILMDEGRKVEKICLLEHSSAILDDAAGQTFLHEFD
ncbi:MAG: AMP-binding protein, partial [Paracoccaceae bacterium]